jgi:hypothetical protein
MSVVRELASGDFGENDAEREDIGGKVKLVAEEDLRRHVCVRATKGEATGLLLVACGYAGKTKVGDLEAAVRGDE